MMFTYGMKLPDMLSSTDYIFNFDQFITNSFDRSEENITSFNTNLIN